MGDKLFLDIAKRLASESKCQSLQVGAVIVKDGRVVSTGINGTPNKAINCNSIRFSDSDSKQYVSDYTTHTVDMEHTEWSSIHEIHAEMNAILYSARKGISTEGATMYVTHEPCDQCLKNIIQSGITRIVYSEPYSGNVVLNNEYRKSCCKFIKLEKHINNTTYEFTLTPKDDNPINVKYTKTLDQHKANIATCYIGFGVKGTSTYNYKLDAERCGLKTNSDVYTHDDVVFVSVNGGNNIDSIVYLNNATRTVELCKKALDSGAILVMDTKINRNLCYNTGEQFVFNRLTEHYKSKNIRIIDMERECYNLYKLEM